MSYAREDVASAQRVFDTQTASSTVWFDKVSLKPGQRWQTEIRRAIAGADCILLLLSKRSTRKRGFYQREIREALEVLKELPEGDAFLIPARLDECHAHFEDVAELQQALKTRANSVGRRIAQAP